jgi:hypothetical protein
MAVFLLRAKYGIAETRTRAPIEPLTLTTTPRTHRAPLGGGAPAKNRKFKVEG